MQIEIVGRNIDITPALKSHVQEKLGHTARALEDVMSAHVILEVEKYRQNAEIVLKRRRGSVTGQASSRDMYQSIQKAIERIETQGRRDREKVIARKRRGTGAKEDAVLAALRSSTPRAVEPEEPEPMAMVEESLDRVKPLGVEEAALLLEKARRPFVAFRNAATGSLAVLYRRPDGRLGLVAPKR